MNRLVVAALALALIVTARSGPAFAQPVQPADGELDATYARGAQAFRDRRYGEALVAFEYVILRRPSPAALFAFGQACRAVSRYVDAIDAFERFVAAPPPDVAPQMLADVREQIAQMRRGLARLVLEVTPPEATLRVDARPVPLVRGGQPIDPGAHILDLAAPGFASERRDVRLEPGTQAILHVELRAIPAERPRLLVEPSVPGAIVSLDGRRLGVGRADERVNPGSHLIEIAAEGHEPFRRVVEVGLTGLTRVDAALRPRARTMPGWVLPTVITGGVLVVAGAIALGVALSSHETAPLPQGNVWDSVVAP